ncbi:MAG: hypothetical protein ACPIA5_07710, partial [Flavobacteriales bacterium]
GVHTHPTEGPNRWVFDGDNGGFFSVRPPGGTSWTNLAVLDIRDGSFHLVERAPGVSVDDIVAATAGPLVVPHDVPEMALD